MNISLNPILDKFINEMVNSGFYNSASEVVRDALRLLQERKASQQMRLAELREEIAKGIEQADRGELSDGDEVFARLRAKAKAKMGKKG